MKFNPDDYGRNAAMHCDTEEKAIIFCNFLDFLGKRWRDDTSYRDTEWHRYGNQMCYSFNRGCYSSLGFYQGSENYGPILEFDDFEWDNYTPPEKEKPVKLRFSW